MAFLSGQRLRLRLLVAPIAGVAMGVTVAAGSAGRAPTVVAPEDVYAAFTLNLTRFVTWPAEAFAAPEDPLVVGTFPEDPINERLDAAVRGQMFEGRPIVTVRIRSMDEVERCHVIFMTRKVGSHPAVLERCARRPILTISDAEGFLELGGHVRFVPQPPRTRLRISVGNLKSSGLQARPQLIRLAAAP